MGAKNKLLLELDGVSIVRRSVEMLTRCNLLEVVVVVGHQADLVRATIEELPVRFVHNKRYSEGQMTSVHAGLEALMALPAPRESAGVLVCLADQVLLESGDIERLGECFFEGARGRILVPMHRGQRGNPVVIARELIPAILEGGANFGCRRFIDNNADLVRTVEMESDHFVIDLDRPEDYQELRSRLAT